MGQISSAPVELIRVQRGGGKKWRGAVAEMQGWRADHEDAHFMRDSEEENSYAVFGVLDGHGGCEVARLAAHDRLPSALLRATEVKDANKLEEMVSVAFVETDAWLRERPEVTRDQSGSTCVVGGIRKKEKEDRYEWFIANAGDSRGIIFRASNDTKKPPHIIVYSEDHKPDRQDEHARIAAAGGFVSDADAAKRAGGGLATVVARLDGNLAVSRGLGDFAYKRDDSREPGQQKVSCLPEIYRSRSFSSQEEENENEEFYGQLEDGDLLILACDGIFDVMSNEQLAAAIAVHLAQGIDIGDIAAGIVSSCLRELNSKDNMTLMIIHVGIDGSDYAFRPSEHTANKKPLPPLSTLPGMQPEEDDGLPRTVSMSPPQEEEHITAKTKDSMDLDEDDDLDDNNEDDETVVVDEIVGIDQYDRQSDDAVKRSYISFLEYCETDKSRKLPREARSLLRRVAKEEARKHSAARDAIARKRFGPDANIDTALGRHSDDGSGTSSRR